MVEEQITYLLVDGENIDGTLADILKDKPSPETRPRWDRVREFAQGAWPATRCRALFFRNESGRNPPFAFLQALLAMGYQPVLLEGPPDVKVVDEGILRTLEALRSRPGNVLLASHDHDFAQALRVLVDGQRRVGILGFPECMATEMRNLTAAGVEMFDIETRTQAFRMRLPRLRIIPLSEFDPAEFL